MRLFCLFDVALVVLFASNAHGNVVAYYRFEDGAAASPANVIHDSSGNGNDGAAISSPLYNSNVPVPFVPQSHAPNALSLGFDATRTEFLAFPQQFIFNGAGAGTLEFWMNVPIQGHAAVVWSRPDVTDTNRFHIYLAGGTDVGPDAAMYLGMDYYDPARTELQTMMFANGPFPIVPNEWTHVAITRSGDDYSFYRNGLLVHQSTDPTPDLPTSVGWQLAGRTHDFHGLVDEIRISDAALLPTEFLNIPEPSALILAVAAFIGHIAYIAVGWQGRRQVRLFVDVGSPS